MNTASKERVEIIPMTLAESREREGNTYGLLPSGSTSSSHLCELSSVSLFNLSKAMFLSHGFCNSNVVLYALSTYIVIFKAIVKTILPYSDVK